MQQECKQQLPLRAWPFGRMAWQQDTACQTGLLRWFSRVTEAVDTLAWLLSTLGIWLGGAKEHSHLDDAITQGLRKTGSSHSNAYEMR